MGNRRRDIHGADFLVGGQQNQVCAVVLERGESEGAAHVELGDLASLGIVDSGLVAAVYGADAAGGGAGGDEVAEELTELSACGEPVDHGAVVGAGEVEKISDDVDANDAFVG